MERALDPPDPPYSDVSFILLELGGAFSAAVAVDGGRIVDGLGGSSGPLGMRAAGALDAEVRVSRRERDEEPRVQRRRGCGGRQARDIGRGPRRVAESH